MTTQATEDVINAPQNGRYLGMEVFTTSGTWTRPADCTAVEVTVVGGGGGGAGVNGGSGGANAGTGGTSQFGSHCSASGGEGGDFQAWSTLNSSMVDCPVGGVGSNGDYNIRGQAGSTFGFTARAYNNTSNTTNFPMGHPGGSSFMGGGGRGAARAANAPNGEGTYGGGGGGPTVGFAANNGAAGQSGAGGGTAVKWITIADDSLGATETVTVGGGGSRGNSTYDGGNGATGVVIVRMYS